jgi:GNAT superfamily N-acetyltransferase
LAGRSAACSNRCLRPPWWAPPPAPPRPSGRRLLELVRTVRVIRRPGVVDFFRYMVMNWMPCFLRSCGIASWNAALRFAANAVDERTEEDGRTSHLRGGRKNIHRYLLGWLVVGRSRHIISFGIGTSMIIRSVERTDIGGVLECLSLATSASTRSTIESTQADRLSTLIEESRRSSTTGVQFVVAVEEKEERDTPHEDTNRQEEVVLGFLIMKRFHHLSMLFVRPDVQRQGIGRRLWEQGVQTAIVQHNNDGEPSSLSCRTATIIITVNSSPTAVTFYQNLGFHISGEPFEKYDQMLTPMIRDCTIPTPTTTTESATSI